MWNNKNATTVLYSTCDKQYEHQMILYIHYEFIVWKWTVKRYH